MAHVYTIGKSSIHGAFGLRFVKYIALNRLKTQLSMFFLGGGAGLFVVKGRLQEQNLRRLPTWG